MTLVDAAVMTGWATDHKDTAAMSTTGINPDGSVRTRGDRITLQALTASTTSSDVSRVLNPAFSRWLMGYPEIWERLSPGQAEWMLLQSLLQDVVESEA